MKTFLRRYGPAILTGVLLAFSFPGLHLFPLAWVALVPLLARVRLASVRTAAGQFLLAGYVYHSILLYWLLTHFYWEGGKAFPAEQLLSIYLSLFWAAAGASWVWMRQRLPQLPAALLLAVLWAGMEWLQGTLLTGFGWSALGYSQGPDLWLLQNAALGGVSLLSALLLLFNTLLAELFTEPHRRPLRAAVALGILVVSHLTGWMLLDEPEFAEQPLRVGVLQPNFAQEIKWDPEFAETMLRMATEKSLTMAAYSDVDFMVWPETLITMDLSRPEVLAVLQGLTEQTGASLYSGTTRSDEAGRGEFNASVFIDAQGALVDYYDKIHLAPFGEFVPFARYLPFMRQVVPVGDVVPGEEPKVFTTNGRRFGPLICFEVLFPDMAERLRKDGADFLVVITNLAWFGKSNALPQELEIARMRAVETRLPLVHSANSGISGVIDPWGRFSPVNVFAGFTEPGRYVEINPEELPGILTRERAFGVFPLPQPAASPLPHGPYWFPRAMLLLSVLLACAAALRRFAGKAKPTTATP